MHILFVEDDPMNRAVVRDMLTTVDVAMAEAEDAETGLRMLDTVDYDAILMDLRMPGMDGLTAIAKIRSRSDARSLTPIIVVTADAGPGLYTRCRAAGADDVIGKPVPMDQLFDKLSDVLSGRSTLAL